MQGLGNFPAASSSATPQTQLHVADISQNSEIIAVTNMSGAGSLTWTVTRGAEGTTPVAHSAGFIIYQVVSAGAYAQLRSTDWLNAVTMFGADNTGATDATAAIQAALNGNGAVYLDKGTFLLNSSPLTFNVNGQVIYGAGEGLTTLKIGASFSGTAAIEITGLLDCGVQGLSIVSSTGQWNTATAANGIEVQHSQRCRIRDVRGYALNGYIAEILSDATGDSFYPLLDHVTASFCAGGVHLQGTNSSNHLMGAFLSNCTFEECENADGLWVEDVIDLTCVNLEVSPAGTPVGGGTPGYPLHIQGYCVSNFYSGYDGGQILIEGSGTGNPYGVTFMGGVVGGGTPGCSVTAGTEITFNGMQFTNNQTFGLSVTGGGRLLVENCTFDANNQSAAATQGDVYWDGTGIGMFQNNLFATPGGSGAGQVAAAVVFHSAAGETNFQNNWFNGIAPGFNATGGFPALARANIGFNPVGNVGPPSVPLSGTALTSPYGEDMMVYLAANAGAACTVAIGSATLYTVPTAGIASFLLAQSQKVTLTYASAPTWVWIGN